MSKLFGNKNNKNNKSSQLGDENINRILGILKKELGDNVEISAIKVDKDGKPVKEVKVNGKEKEIKKEDAYKKIVANIEEEYKKDNCNTEKIENLLKSLEPDDIQKAITNQKLSIAKHTKDMSDDEVFRSITRITTDMLESLGRLPKLGFLFLADGEGNISAASIGITRKNKDEVLEIFDDTIERHIDE